MSKLIAQVLPSADTLTVDPNNYYRQILHGYYNFNCVVGEGVVRTAKFYVPEGSVYNQPTIFVGVPSGYATDEFLLDSGWKKYADEKRVYVVMMEPENGQWGDLEKETRYLTELSNDVSLRPFFCAFAPTFFGFAYGDAAAVLAHQSRLFPKCWAGVALLGPCGMSEEEQAGLAAKETRAPGVMYSQVQMPVWQASTVQDENFTRAVEFYRTANHSAPEAEQHGHARVWKPLEGGTVDEHWCAVVAAEERDWHDCMNEETIETIYSTVFAGVARYPGNANGALRRYAPIAQRGFEKFSAMVAGGYQEDGSDLYCREWYVYKPETVDDSKPSPVVFVFHGAGGSGDEIADRSGWSDMAKKYGFLIVCPSASVPNRVRNVSDMMTNEMFRAMWNTGRPQETRPADLLFVDYLYQWLVEYYNVDKSRVYASGQSSGGMMSWACGCYRSDYFAAVAPVSAKTQNIENEPEPFVKGSVIPVMANLGLMDNAFKGGFSTPDARGLIELWHDTFGLVENWDSYTYDDGGKKCSYQEGLFTNYLYRTPAGVPLMRCVEAATKTHAIWPSECEMAWTEFLSHYTKDPQTKELFYDGVKVY